MMKINIQNIDLNLLVIFDALMTKRKVAKAAESVNLSQSAMSHALNRLRVLLDDPVLVRTEFGMEPTPRAKALELPIREVLTKIQLNLYAPEPFDPLTSEKTFVVYSTEYFESVFLPPLVARLEKLAPGVKVMMGILTQEIPESELANGDVDLVVGVEHVSEIPKRMQSEFWEKDSLSCIVRKQNPEVGSRISLKQFIKIPHIYHMTLGTPFAYSLLDKWLQRNNIQRRFAVATTGYLSAAMIAAETNYLLTVPSRLAQKLVKTMNLRIVGPPKSFPDYKLNLIWHPLYEKDPTRLWFRNQLTDLVTGQ
jgi:DNA-binding transcriptional LysR family regulator